MSKQCPACSAEIKNNSSQWANKIYCSKKCRASEHRKKKSQITRIQQRRANMRQNEEVLRLVRECKRAGTVQILAGHNLESFIETMKLVRERPKGDVRLCHIAPVKGDGFIGGGCRNRVQHGH
jgi:predicted RNA-binding protein (virulence factor B family)